MSMTGEDLLAQGLERRRKQLSPVATDQKNIWTSNPSIGTLSPVPKSQRDSQQDGGGGLGDITPSFLGAAGKAISMVPTFFGKAGQTLYGLAEGITDIPSELTQLAGGPDWYTSRMDVDIQRAEEMGLKGWDKFLFAGHRTYPLVSDMLRGFQHTGSNIVDIAPGVDTGQPGVDYAAAYRRGDLGEQIFFDLGNIVLAGRLTGAGNVIGQAGGAVGKAGMPRLGAGIARTGRFVEEPLGTMTRGAARVGQFGAETLNLPGAARLGRVAQAGLPGTTVGPLRQGVAELLDVRQTRAWADFQSTQADINNLYKQLDSTTQGDTQTQGQLIAEINQKTKQLTNALSRTGLPRLARKNIYARQMYEEARRSVIQTEFARLKTLGPRAVFPDAEAGPMPDFAGPVVTLITTEIIAKIIDEVDAGKTVSEITQALNSPLVGPDLEAIGYLFTEEHVQKAIDYERGTLSKFDRQSIDATLQWIKTVSDEFTAGQSSGEYRLGGPMPETYLGTKPIVEFLLSEADNGRLRKTEQTAMFTFLDGATAQLLERFSDEQKQGLDFPVDKPEGAFRALATVPANHPLAGIAQRMIEILHPQLLKDFPNIFRRPSIYPANVRPMVFFDNRMLAASRAQDINTIVSGLNLIADRYGNAIGKGLVESLRNDLAEVVGTPRQYLPGSYTRILGKMRNLLLRVREDIVKLQEKQAALSVENLRLKTQLTEAEQALGLVEQTVRALVDNLNQISDETLAGVTEAKTNLGLSQEQVRIAEEAIRVYEREQAQAQLALTPDERQVLVDEIDRAARWIREFEDPDALDNLIAEFDFRRREVEAGRPDPVAGEDIYTARSPEVKARKEQMIQDAKRRALAGIADVDAIGADRFNKMSWYAWNIESFPGSMQSYKSIMESYLSEMFDPDVVKRALREFQREHVLKKNERTRAGGLGSTGEDFVASSISDEMFDRYESGAEKIAKGGLDRELARRVGEFWKAVIDERNAKAMRLDDLAKKMNAEIVGQYRETLDLPITARIIAYATNPTLLSADLMLRDRYVTEMETGVPYEGAPQRLIPIPKELLDQLVQAQKDVTKQEKTVARLRREGTEEQRRLTRTRLKGVGKIVEQPDGTVEGQLLKGPQTKAESAIEQMRNKDLYQQNKLEELRAKNAERDAIEADVQGVAQSATAVEQYMARPFAPMLLGDESRLGYLPGGLPRTAREAARVSTELRTEGAAPQVASPVEQMRTTDIRPLRLDDIATRFDEIFNVIGRNRVIEDIITDPFFARRMGSFVNEELVQSLEKQARATVNAQNIIRTPSEVNAAVRIEVSRALFEIAKREGYEPVTPVKVDPDTGAHEAVGDLLRTVSETEVDLNTIMMRRGLRERITQEFQRQGASNMNPALQKAYETISNVTTGWKGIVLPFKLRWQIGDAVSNVLNAWARGDVSPADLVRRMREVDLMLSSSGKRLEVLGEGLQNDLLSVLRAAGLQAEGLYGDLGRQLRGMNPRAALPERQLTGPFGITTPGLRMFPNFREKSFRFNEYQNFLARVATGIEKLDRVLAERGRTIDDVNASTYTNDPVIRDAVNEAVRATNDALGAFTQLTPFEKRTVRNIYPFWSWIRFINKAAIEMAVDSPDRILFAASLGSIVAEPEQAGLFPFLRGMTPVMGYFFDLSFLNPYQDAIILSENPVRELTEQIMNVSPALAAPARIASTTSYYLGGPQLPFPGGSVQRPGYLEGSSQASTRSFGDYVGELGYYGLQTFGGPFSGALTYFPTGARIPGTDVALGNVQRFPQGSARTQGRYAAERLPRGVGLLSSVFSTFGIPRPVISEEVANQQARLQAIADIRAQERRQRERLLSRIVT